MHLERISYTTIKEQLLSAQGLGHNFSKDVVFPFPTSYRLLVCHIRTVILAADCILYSAVEATNESKAFHTDDYWCFGGSGQGDRWLLDVEGMVYFYDHDYDEGFQPMGISFEQWVEMAFLLKQWEDCLDSGVEAIELELEMFELLNSIHPDLSESYPYSF